MNSGKAILVGVTSAAAGLLLVRLALAPRASGGLEPTVAEKAPDAKAARRFVLHKAERPILTAAARQILQRDPTLAEIQYLHAIAWLETSYARGWKGSMIGSNNYGAVQCPAGVSGVEGVSAVELFEAFERAFVDGRVRREWTLAGNCIEYSDSHPDGTRYAVSFRAYATPEEGAADLAHHVFRLRPGVVRGLSGRGASAFRASLAMRRERYYGGFCPEATKAHGAQAARASFGTPDRDAGTAACEREAVEAHAKRAHGIVAEVAQAVGDAERLPLGTFEEAFAWWKGGHA